MKISIGRFEFPTKTAAKEHARRVLWSTPRGMRLFGDDAEFAISLAEIHPDAEKKIGVGIGFVSVGTAEYNAPCFQITRLDGSVANFSYKTAMDGQPNHRSRVKTAMWWTIDPQIRSFRREQFAAHPAYRCEETGILITDTPGTEVDHVNPTFAQLTEEYAAGVGGFDAIGLCSTDAHPGLALEVHHRVGFWQFHAERALLQLVHRQGNIARARRAS